MKLTLARRGPADRSEAWACVSANLAFPGAGSLAAGRAIGYGQLALTFIGFMVTTVAGAKLATWMLKNYASISAGTMDPYEQLLTLWREARWPLVGLVLFGISWVWSCITNMQILAEHPKNPVPPVIR
jgi:hypothetical protein